MVRSGRGPDRSSSSSFTAPKRSMPGMARRSVASRLAASSTVVSWVIPAVAGTPLYDAPVVALAGDVVRAGRAGPAAVSVRATDADTLRIA